VIYLPPTNEVISFGDLILAFGLIDVAYEASRRRRRTITRSDATDALRATATDTVGLEVSESAPDELVRVLPRHERRSAEIAERNDALERVDDPARSSVGAPRT
jgi:hypothetical protein